jgi:hypothetical protein
VAGAHRRAIQVIQTASLEDPIHDGGRQVLVMKDTTPLRGVLVGGEDHRAASEVALVDDVEQHVRRIRAVAQVAHLIDYQHIRVGVAWQLLRQFPLAGGQGEFVDELRGGEEQGVEAVLDGPVGDGHSQVRLALMQSST